MWRALTEPALLAAWLMENDIRPVVGHRFQVRAQPVPGWNGIAARGKVGERLAQAERSRSPASPVAAPLPAHHDRPMEPDFWRDRWNTNRIGFHLEAPNPRLVEHWKDVASPSIRRVLVPLCGKSLDLAYLADQGLEVVGVELVESAAQAFFAERGVTPEVTTAGPFTRYASGRIAIYVGDFFDATAERLGGAFDAAFDRASLIALPPEMRARYVATLRSLLGPHAPILLVLLDHGGPGGPPFAIKEAEARALHADARVDRLSVVELGEEDAQRRNAARVEEITLRVVY